MQPRDSGFDSLGGRCYNRATLDFGFIEPDVLGAVMRAARNGKELPKSVSGRLTARVAMPLDALLRVQQQLQQVLEGSRAARGK